ncbi:MAG: hypothetical protein K2M80_00510, partial [Muribaculaceae bacterium]|nr:hypothetical protein [Muribaculaceae bacterium]
AGAASASHDVNNAFEPTEGFPIDENGQSVNDRDYLRDKDAQRIVEQMAGAYDNRALQTPVIVSQDGVVLSGNNRTMSGDLAARQGTDKAYVDYLREFGQKYGFTPEQVAGMNNPRLVFVPDEALPYDATTFSRFNAQEMKSQSKPEAAVKLGKIVPDNVFNNIVSDISRYDRLSDYYADEKAVAHALGALMQAGVINDKQMPEMRTGTALSAAGKELIENTLIGKVFQTTPDAVRQIISMPTLRQSIVMGLNEIAHNRTLARQGYDLSEELAKAVDLVYQAKKSKPEIYKEGMPVSPFGRMQGLFDDEYGESRVTDATTLLLADLLNSGKPSDLRKVLTTYNNEASQSASGQADIFTGEVLTKENILTDVNEHFRNATPREQQALVDAAIAERKRRAEVEAEQRGRDQEREQIENAVERSADSPVATVEPTEAQKAAGNYKKEHRSLDGHRISIENPKGSIRRGRDADGKEWQSEMHHDYGYFIGAKSTDGDNIDVFLSDNPAEGNVYVVDQYHPDGEFDEHKVMYGFNSEEEAMQAYLSNYEPGWEQTRRLDITGVNKDDFKAWLRESKRKRKPFADYAGVKAVCPVCGKAGIPNYHSHDVVCPQCNSDLSVFRLIDQLSEEEKQEMSDKFKGEDNQGNPIDHEGRLIVEDVKTLEEIKDDDFLNPTRTIGLPPLPAIVDKAIGANGKKVIIKKKILDKNHEHHRDLTPTDSRHILRTALYTPALYGQNQLETRPCNWILIHLADKNTCVLIEVDRSKDNCEIVNWHYLSEEALERKKRQAIKEGGRILTLSEDNVAANTHNSLSSTGKDSALSSEKQEEKYYGADTVPTDEILRGMSYEQVEEQAALYSEKIAERYDTQIELAEAEATVIEDKWRRTPQEGRHLKALKEKIANLRERREAEMRAAGRRFNEALKNHPDRPKPLSLADIAEAEEAAERDKSLSVDDKDDTIYVSDSARSARRGVAQAKEASEKAVEALVDTVWSKDSYSEADIDELERANADARTAYHEKLDEYADALLKATEDEVDSFAGQINRGVARAEHEEITNLSRNFDLKDETRKKFEAFAGRLTEAIERQRSAKAYGEATDISNFEAKRPKKFSIAEASDDRNPNQAYHGVSHRADDKVALATNGNVLVVTEKDYD